MSEQPPEGQPQQPWQPPGQGYPQQNYPQYVPEPPATSKATLALVLGIVGLTVCPGAASIPAWIIGHEAVKEIDSSNGTLGGRSMAVAGKITGIIGSIMFVLGLLAIAAIFAFGALFVSSIDDCSATGNDSDFSVQC